MEMVQDDKTIIRIRCFLNKFVIIQTDYENDHQLLEAIVVIMFVDQLT